MDKRGEIIIYSTVGIHHFNYYYTLANWTRYEPFDIGGDIKQQELHLNCIRFMCLCFLVGLKLALLVELLVNLI